jgi:AcrR family transcriptional regulator
VGAGPAEAPAQKSSEPSAKQRRRQRISDAATALFFARGFDAVSIADIAEAAEVSKMTVTNHFPLKEDLLFDEFAAELLAVRTAVAGCASIDDAVDAIESYCANREHSGGASRALARAPQPDEAVGDSRTERDSLAADGSPRVRDPRAERGSRTERDSAPAADAWAAFAGVVLPSRALTQRLHAHYADMASVIASALPDSLPGHEAQIEAWLLAETVHLVDWWPFQAVADGMPAAEIRQQRVRVRVQAFERLRTGIADRG